MKCISCRYTHTLFLLSLPPTPSTPRSSQSAELSFLCYTAASHQLSVLHVVLCICRCYSQCVPISFPSCVSLFSTSVSLFLPCKYIHQYHFSRLQADSSLPEPPRKPIYMHSDIFAFLSFWLTSLFITGSRFVYLTTTASNLFLFMDE